MVLNSLLLKDEDPTGVSTNVFGLEQLFYMPLKAVIDANTLAALSAIDIIREYGFENDKSSENYGKLKMVTFSYDYAGSGGHIQTMSISIPFITLIPLPILEVKHAEIDFSLKVLGQLDIEVNKNNSKEVSQNLLAVFAPEKSNQSMNLSLEANMNVNIKVGQSDLPGGIIQLLNLGQAATIGDTLFDLNYTPSMLNFGARDQLTLDIYYEITGELPNDIIFDVSVEPSYETEISPFVHPIEILKGNLYGKATWQHIQVIPAVDGGRASFNLQFSAGEEVSNGFIIIHSNYSSQLKIYYSIN